MRCSNLFSNATIINAYPAAEIPTIWLSAMPPRPVRYQNAAPLMTPPKMVHQKTLGPYSVSTMLPVHQMMRQLPRRCQKAAIRSAFDG